MKIGIKQLKRHYVPPQTAFGRASSVTKNNKEEFSLLDSTMHQPTEVLISRDLTILERRLDKCEISSKNSSIPTTTSLSQEMNFYLDYLSGISVSIKAKDAKLSKTIHRGLIGIEKTFKKLVKKYVNDQILLNSLKKPRNQDESNQTEEEKIEKKEFEVLPDVESFKQMAEGFRKIKVSRVVGRLLELYESLCQMQTDVPELTVLPDPHVENTSPEKLMSMHLNVIKNHVFHILNDSKSEGLKSTQNKFCQIDTPLVQIPEYRVLERVVYDKEQEIQKIKEKSQSVVSEKMILEDKMKKMQNFFMEVEKKQNEKEIEVVQIKNKFQHSEIVIVAQEKRIQWFDGKLLKKTEKLIRAKLRIDELKKMILNKQKAMNKLQDELFDTKIKWKVCEEKLIDIETAWFKRTGKQFDHKIIDIELIINKHSITNENLEDEAEKRFFEDKESSVSDNAPPDQEEFEDLIKTSKEKMKEPLQTFVQSTKKSRFLEIMNTEVKKQIGEQGLMKELRKKIGFDEESESGSQEEGHDVCQDPKPRKSQKRQSHASKNKEFFGVKDKESSVSSLSNDSVVEENIVSASKSTRPSQVHRNSNLRSKNKSQSSEIPEKDLKLTQSSAVQSYSSKFDSPENKKKSIKTEKRVFSSTMQITETVTVKNSIKGSDLARLETKLTIELEKKEKELISTLVNNQPNLFSQYKILKSELERVRKELNIQILSTAVQCNLIGGVNQEEFKAAAWEGSQGRHEGVRKGTSEEIKEGIKEGTKDTVRDPLDDLKGDEDVRALLGTVFENDAVLQKLSLIDKLQIVKSMKGHQKDKCKEMCPHLLRVLKIKWKSRGTLYPIRNILMKSMEF